jgi:hypothetical protein
MRPWILPVCAIVAVAHFLAPAPISAEETEDHQAIRMLFQKEQEGWRKGNGAQVLSCYAESYVAYWVPVRNGRPNFLQTSIATWGAREAMETRLLAPDFVGMKAALADTTVNMVHTYELNRIDVQGNEGVAISTIAWASTDTLRNVRTQQGHQSMWFLRKIEGEWKYVGVMAALSSYREENPLQN